MATGKPDVDRDDRLNAILLDYEEALERGEAPDRRRLLDSHPEFAAELGAFFATRDRLDRVTAPLRAVGGSDTRAGLRNGAALPGPELGQIGDFQLLREVGRGGMGVVYEAEQLSLRRRVALKVLPFVAAIDPRHLQRFRNEAQAAAQLHHTHIVPVFAVGADRGVHYYAMQFIEGQSLAQLIDDLRDAEAMIPLNVSTDRATPLRAGSFSAERAARRSGYFRRVVALVKQAAEALDYAHQVGVVHRDIKPANLMIDDTARLWVTDFGLAQVRDEVGLTATGELVGTLRYMSPEQAAGQRGIVDHRTDIYSLGVTLYELLTLTPPFGTEDGRALLYQIAHIEPRPPRAADRAIPAELETIVLKAIAKLPADRYATAQEFADDLQRFLDDRPIHARRPTLADRATKWVRRHRAVTLGAVLALLVAAVGLAAGIAIVLREHGQTKAALEGERRANERERERAREAAEGRAEAEDNYRRTRRAVDLFVELSDEELLDFPPFASFRQRLLEAAVAYYQELRDRREDAAVRADLDASRDRLARLQEELSALTDYNTALLLDQSVVRAELELTDAQASRLAPVLERLRTFQRLPGARDRGNRKSVAGQVAAARREIEGVLTAAQYNRLRQVSLQIPGPHVFGPDIIAALGLSDAQKGQVRRVHAEATQASLRQFITAADRDDAHREFDRLWKRANEQIVAALTPTQKARWADMTGPPVRGEVRFPIPVSDGRK